MDFILDLLKMFLIGSGFGLIVGLMIYFKQNKKDKNISIKEEVNSD